MLNCSLEVHPPVVDFTVLVLILMNETSLGGIKKSVLLLYTPLLMD